MRTPCNRQVELVSATCTALITSPSVDRPPCRAGTSLTPFRPKQTSVELRTPRRPRVVRSVLQNTKVATRTPPSPNLHTTTNRAPNLASTHSPIRPFTSPHLVVNPAKNNEPQGGELANKIQLRQNRNRPTHTQTRTVEKRHAEPVTETPSTTSPRVGHVTHNLRPPTALE